MLRLVPEEKEFLFALKAYVNFTKIGEIHILNTDKKTKTGRHIYKILAPKGYENKKIYHLREDGWKILAEKALKIMNNPEQ